METILAHAGGLDELAIFLFPVFVGIGVWILTKRPSPPKEPSADTKAQADEKDA